MKCYAVIDIGSNSVRLMLWADGKTLYKRLETTRLGAAVRVARNGKELCRAIERACGLRVDVVSGEEEALLGAAGALSQKDGGIIDIGGASTEVFFRKAGVTQFSVSMNVGAVRLFDKRRDFSACNVRADGNGFCDRRYGVHACLYRARRRALFRRFGWNAAELRVRVRYGVPLAANDGGRAQKGARRGRKTRRRDCGRRLSACKNHGNITVERRCFFRCGQPGRILTKECDRKGRR